MASIQRFGGGRKIVGALCLLSIGIFSVFFARKHIFAPRKSVVAKLASLEDVVQIAKDIYQQGKPVLLNVFNSGFTNMTLNWLCHTQPMNIHKHVLLVTQDVATMEAIRGMNYQVTVVALVDQKSAKVSGDQNFGQLGYHRLLVFRAMVLSALLKGGVEVIQFESDATWLVDPYPLTLTYASLDGRDFDLVYLTCWGGELEVPTGYMYLRPRPPVVTLISKMAEMLTNAVAKLEDKGNSEPISWELHDQAVLSRLYHAKNNEVKGQRVPWNIAPDGKWYDTPEAKRPASVIMISNNYIMGNRNKIERARAFKHWFLDERGICNSALARTFVETNLRSCKYFCE